MHRNWLAITYQLPLSEWYFNDTSKWTLDYPPFFAYFEWLMAQVAVLVDPQITTVQKKPYKATSCVMFQRTTVVVSDFVLFYACYRICKGLDKMNEGKPNRKTTMKVLFLLNYINIGLFMIDNIHFQYNSMMYGLLLLSIAFIFEVSYPALIVSGQTDGECCDVRGGAQFQAHLPV